MWLVYGISFLAAFFISNILTYLAIKIAPKVGFVDMPSGRKVHTEPIPYGGGLAIILSVSAVIGGVVALATAMSASPDEFGLGELMTAYAGGVSIIFKKLVFAGAGAAALMVMGILDDKRGLGAVPKLVIQIAVAALVVYAGMSVTVFLPWKAAGWAITVAWLIFVMNSFNLLDNMDGLSAGVAAIIAAVFFVVALETGQVFSAEILAVFLGAVLGFLVFNLPPARIFMGDTGSYFLGYVLGLTAVVFTFVPKEKETTSLMPLALPFILFAIPFYDTVSVVLIRLREGRHPFDADKRHFSHRLTDLGMNKSEAVAAIYLATLATAFPALYLYHLNFYSLLGAVVQALLVLMVIAILEHAGARKKRDA